MPDRIPSDCGNYPEDWEDDNGVRFMITKLVDGCTYYLEDVTYNNAEFIYRWAGLKNNAALLTLKVKNKYLDDLKKRFSWEDYGYIKKLKAKNNIDVSV